MTASDEQRGDRLSGGCTDPTPARIVVKARLAGVAKTARPVEKVENTTE